MVVIKVSTFIDFATAKSSQNFPQMHFFLIFTLTVISISPNIVAQQNATIPCPLDFTILRQFGADSTRTDMDISTQCHYIRQGLRLVQSHYLQLSSSFLPPLNSSESCWLSYQSLVDGYVSNFDIRKSCGFQTSWISYGCMNITTKSQFESMIPNSTLDDVVSNCNQSLENNSPCASCTTSLSRLQVDLPGPSIGNVSDCTAYPSIYAAAFANQFGPTDPGTAKCLFLLDLDLISSNSSHKKRNILILIVMILLGIGILVAIAGVGFLWRRRRHRKRTNEKLLRLETGFGSTFESIKESTSLVKFTFEEIKKATRNFSRDHIIGRGGYGNVYKGILFDGSEVAFKRFKNCSATGDANFAHEVEVIASVRHVNLVALRGYCIATGKLEGHQRIIVCDLMKNGSVYDHLFGNFEENAVALSWSIRQKIIIGTARGLAYLHHGAQPGIIHRDIKGSNILLDENFEPKVADFGLAKFTPEGASHLSTRVAGTMGYVAPEYALYGQLTERSDVYSFGVVFLEILSGKKALLACNESQPCLVTDWAWGLVKKGRAIDVVDKEIPDLGEPEVLEKYVLVAVLCSHPQLYARPTMDQVVKMLETDISVPSIPDRPIPLVSEIDDIERSVSSGASSYLSTSLGYQAYFETELSSHKEDGETSNPFDLV